MALIIKSEKRRIIAKTKYEDNGTIKTANRNLSPSGEMDDTYMDDDGANAEELVQAFQKVTTDTVESFYVEYVTTYERQEGDWGTPGTVTSAWDGYDDVRLINYFTDGDNNSRKYTVQRAATGATDSQLRAFGMAQRHVTGNEYTAINGDFTGATVSSAWVNN